MISIQVDLSSFILW